MTLKIEAGKFYRTRDGRKVGPMLPWHEYFADPNSRLWWPNGGRGSPYNVNIPSEDIIAEWTDETAEPDEPVTSKPYIAPFKPNQRLALEPIANGGWIVSAVSPYYGQEAERLGAFGSAADMLSALHDALTVRNGGDA